LFGEEVGEKKYSQPMEQAKDQKRCSNRLALKLKKLDSAEDQILKSEIDQSTE